MLLQDECEIAIVSDMPEGIGKGDYVNPSWHTPMSIRAANLVKVVWLKQEKQVKAPKWPCD